MSRCASSERRALFLPMLPPQPLLVRFHLSRRLTDLICNRHTWHHSDEVLRAMYRTSPTMPMPMPMLMLVPKPKPFDCHGQGMPPQQGTVQVYVCLSVSMHGSLCVYVCRCTYLRGWRQVGESTYLGQNWGQGISAAPDRATEVSSGTGGTSSLFSYKFLFFLLIANRHRRERLCCSRLPVQVTQTN